MKLIWFLLHNNSRKTFLVMFLGLLSGVASVALIALINRALYAGSAGHHARTLLALAFVGIVFVKVAASLASGLFLGYSLQEIVLNLCDRLCRKIAATPFRKLEEIGAPRIMTCLTDDVAILSSAIQALPALIVNLAVLAGCTIYLAWISKIAALVLTVLVILIGVTYRLLMVKAMAAVQRARDGRDILFKHFRTLVEGIKELKLHRERSADFFREDIYPAADYLRKENIIAMNQYAVADGWSQSMFYALLAVVLFVFPNWQHVDVKTLTAYIFVALYVMSPVWGIIGSVPAFNRGQTSLEKLEKLGLALDDMQGPASASSPSPSVLSKLPSYQDPPLIQFRDVVFHYTQKDDPEGFTLGPVNLTLHPRELIFIIGGNGSGKSTLARLLTGLYPPDAGAISVDGIPVAGGDQPEYQQLFSAVFSDFFLFDRLLGLPKSSDVQKNAQEYLRTLELSHKVQMNGNTFSTIALSQGQRRRLALLSAYMEDRPVYVLDEWAADQDPRFREIFYLKLLPELRSRGKTVVVITHDDRYFHLGDRVIKLDYGKITGESRPVATVPTPAVPAASLRP